jgi:hypothetical protein
MITVDTAEAANTRTGDVLERMVLPALDLGGYEYQQRQNIGKRFGALGRHFVDLVVTSKTGQHFLVSLKWQQSSGTAEQKVPFEVICLAEAIRQSNGAYTRAYLVLGGPGWTLKDFYVGGGLKDYLCGVDAVTILTLDDFVARANRRRL